MLIDFFAGFNPIYQALIATLFTWLVTAAGAALVNYFYATIFHTILLIGFLI